MFIVFHSLSLQYVDQIVMSQTLARSLAQVCSKKLSTLYSAAEQMQSEQQTQGGNSSTRTSSSSVPSPVPAITSERYSLGFKWKTLNIVPVTVINYLTSPPLPQINHLSQYLSVIIFEFPQTFSQETLLANRQVKDRTRLSDCKIH